MKKAGKTAKILAFTILALFLASFLIGVVSAEGTVFDEVKNSLSKFFSGISGVSNDIFAQGLLIILLVLLIYSIEDFLPFFPTGPGKDWIKWAAAIIISVLGLAFMPKEDIKGILISYEALGIVLTSFLPFFIMLAFTIKWDTKYPQYGWITTTLWIAFFIYLVFRWGNLPANASIKWAYPLTFIISLIFLASKGWISRMMLRSLLKGDLNQYKTLNTTELTARAMTLYDEAAKIASVDPTKAQDLQAEANRLERWAYSMR